MNDDQFQRVGSRVHVGIPRPYDGAMAAVVGDDFLLVVDGTSYAPFAAEFVARVESERGVRPRILVVTHQHFDHFAGLNAFTEPIIATRLTEEILRRYDQRWLDENLAVWKERDMVITELLGEPAVRLPSILIDGPVRLDLGGVTADVLPVGGHVPDLAVVHVAGEGVLLASDMIGNGRDLIFDDSDLGAWAAALERFAALPITTVVPGHGPVAGPELLQQQLDHVLAKGVQLQ